MQVIIPAKYINHVYIQRWRDFYKQRSEMYRMDAEDATRNKDRANSVVYAEQARRDLAAHKKLKKLIELWECIGTLTDVTLNTQQEMEWFSRPPHKDVRKDKPV